MQAFTAKYIFDGYCINENHVVLVKDGIIEDVVPKSNLPLEVKVTDLGNGVITPGFIDLQLNGCGGVLFNNQITLNTLEVMRKTWHQYGATGFLPTFITDDFRNLIKALEVTKEWFEKYGNSRGVLGIHLEGPFISKIKCGIHPKEFIIAPTMDLLKQIVAYRKFFLIKMTIAVEHFSSEQLKFLLDNKIILSIGHSNADFETAQQSIDLGVTTATHMFNAMSGLSGRNPGVVAAILSNDIYTGVIADMLHVDSANIQLLQKIKQELVYLVTDAVTPTGTDITEFEFAGKVLHVENGTCIDKDGVLGGACLTMNEAVRNCVIRCNFSLSDSLKMASLIPAKVLGLDNILGKIKSGYRADIVYLDLDDFTCKEIK